MKNIIILINIICCILIFSDLFNGIYKNISILIITFIYLYYFVINKKKLLLYFTDLYFKSSNKIDLTKYKSIDDFYIKHFNSKRRNDMKNESKKLDCINIQESSLSFEHIKYLYNFLNTKINNIYNRYFDFILSLLVISTFQLNYLNYYDENQILLGWSSYFIDDGIYYDFLSSPNNTFISHICLNSIKFCFKNNIKIIDLGPTHDDIKERKFNCETYKINTQFMEIFR